MVAEFISSDWYFKRLDDGSVRIRCTTGEIALDEATWESIVDTLTNKAEGCADARE